MVLIMHTLVRKIRYMAKKKTSTERHQSKAFNFRMPDQMRLQLLKLTKKNMSNPTEELRRAMRLLLEKEGLWPPPESEKF